MVAQDKLLAGFPIYIAVRTHAHPDTNSVVDRVARDTFWAGFFPPGGGFITITHGRQPIQPRPEIPVLLDAFWAVATFTSYDVYPIRAGGIYTEMHFHIDQVIGPDENTTLRGGEAIDVDVAGGTLVMPSGKVVRQKGPEVDFDYPLIPKKRYLIQLVPVSQGNFFVSKDYWDLSTGVALPVLPYAISLAQNGKSELAGKNEDQAIAIVQESISTLQDREMRQK